VASRVWWWWPRIVRSRKMCSRARPLIVRARRLKARYLGSGFSFLPLSSATIQHTPLGSYWVAPVQGLFVGAPTERVYGMHDSCKTLACVHAGARSGWDVSQSGRAFFQTGAQPMRVRGWGPCWTVMFHSLAGLGRACGQFNKSFQA
jgi:hypothetical protein